MAKTLISIVGPTAVGKTALSVQVARHFQTEIISADSRQFYREMSIGTAKPTKQEQQGIPHHFINSHSVRDSFSAGDFEQQGLLCLREIFQHKDLAVLTGGSGLFINALLQGLDELPKPEPGVREGLNRLYKEQGITVLQERLKRQDPLYFQQVDSQNPQRMIRALEVIESSGIPFSSWRGKHKQKRDFQLISIGLEMERERLYERINLRVEQMLQAGLLDEVKQLLPYQHYPALQTVGYAELFAYLSAEMTLEQAVAKIQQNSRKYAKRQLTWFKRDPQTRWFTPEQPEAIIQYIHSRLG